MAQTKLFAPEGFHFMITPSKGFYLMKDPVTGYEKHSLRDGTYSSKHVRLEYPVNHSNVHDAFHYTTLTQSTNYKPKKAKTTQIASQPSPEAPSPGIIRTVRVTPSTSSTGEGSGGSGGGGY